MALLISIGFVCFTAFADGIEWEYDGVTKTLYISGSGEMDDYSEPYAAPWGIHIYEMQNLVVEDGVKSLGNYAFAGASSLSSVVLSDSVTAIGAGAFSSTPSLLELSLSPDIAKIGDKSFATIGADNKNGFVLNVTAGSFALNYAIDNEIPFACESVKSGEQQVDIKKETGMAAYFPYTAPVNGTFSFYSVSKYDTLGYVYDSEFNQLAANDDHGSLYYDGMEDCDFAISINLTKGETYYFAAMNYSPIRAANFKAYIIPTGYNVSGEIRALISPDGTMSENVLSNAEINGALTDGTYSINVPSPAYKVTFSCEGVRYVHTFSPDDGDDVDIAIVMCDQNSDGFVNIRDYSLMKQNNSEYIDYFNDFINYAY